jgi:hypothetical protein
MEEVFASPPPSARPAAVKLKASRYVHGLEAACGSPGIVTAPRTVCWLGVRCLGYDQYLPIADSRHSVENRKSVFIDSRPFG